MTLDKLSPGQEAVISAVAGEDPFRLRLLDMGFTPKAHVKVTRTAPMGDPIELLIRGYTLTIRRSDAASVEVETLP